MSEGPAWWALLPPADVLVSCGDGEHRLRWADGRLTAPDHPDAEGELVLAVLGGDRSRCVGLIESWDRRGEDLEVLAVGPRSAADELRLTRPAADAPAAPGPLGGAGGGWFTYAPLTGRSYPARRVWAWPRRPGPTAAMLARRHMAVAAISSRRIAGGGAARLRARRPPARDGAGRAAERRAELLSLLARGPEFQLRLSATVAAAWAGGRRAAARPALTAGLAGRLGPAIQAWQGVEPGRVDVELHEDDGWGRLASSGDRLGVALPVSWLASVWAPGLAVVAGHLVVSVTEAAWPAATVLALPGPAAEPVILKVRAVDGGWIRAEGAR